MRCYTSAGVVLAAPILQDVVGRCCDIFGVVTPEHYFSVFAEHWFYLFSPVHLEFSVVGDVIFGHEILDGGTEVPAIGRDLIASEMDVGTVCK